MNWKQRAKLKEQKRERRTHRRWLNNLPDSVFKLPPPCQCRGCASTSEGWFVR